MTFKEHQELFEVMEDVGLIIDYLQYRGATERDLLVARKLINANSSILNIVDRSMKRGWLGQILDAVRGA